MFDWEGLCQKQKPFVNLMGYADGHTVIWNVEFLSLIHISEPTRLR